MTNQTRQTKDERVTVRLTERVMRRLAERAAAKDQAVGEYVRLAVLRQVEADERRSA